MLKGWSVPGWYYYFIWPPSSKFDYGVLSGQSEGLEFLVRNFEFRECNCLPVECSGIRTGFEKLTELFSQKRRSIGNLDLQLFWRIWRIESAIGMLAGLIYLFRRNLARWLNCLKRSSSTAAISFPSITIQADESP